ncbi:hypothetical protein [Stackebrandtia soli]|uniref:hypothetical protein n=1 Tax=Stackebrandtia soli TaxID=1892856 RepID=UPI0039E9BD12
MEELRDQAARADERRRRVIEDFEHRAASMVERLERETRELRTTELKSPEGAPSGYRKVLERVNSGEVKGEDVLTGAGDDPDVQKAHEWIRPRLEVMSRVGQLVKQGFEFERARELALDEYRERMEKRAR